MITPPSLSEVLSAYQSAMGQALQSKGGEFHGPCPIERAGEDRFWVKEDRGSLVFGCRSCGTTGDRAAWYRELMDALGFHLPTEDLREKPQPPGFGCTLALLAERAGLPKEFLTSLGWRDARHAVEQEGEWVSVDSVSIPYRDRAGELIKRKYRVRPHGPDHYRWEKGGGAMVYGADRIQDAEDDPRSYLCVVEGETDAATLWHYGIAAIGVPGASSCKVIEAEHVGGVIKLYVVAEADGAGDEFPAAVQARVRHLGLDVVVLVVRMRELLAKDVNELHKADPGSFKRRFGRAIRYARGLRKSKIDARRFWTGKEIGKATFPPVRCVIEGVLPEGMCYLMGSPKCGKSWLALDLAIGVAAGRDAAGKWHPEGGEALYIDTEQIIGAATAFRLSKLSGFSERLTYIDEWEPFSVDPASRDDGVEEIDIWLEEHPLCRIVVVDISAAVWPSVFRGNVYEAEYQLGRRLNRLGQKRRCCILLVHHDRKAEGRSVIDNVSGSRARVGAAAALLWLTREIGSELGQLGVTGRTGVVEKVWAARFDPRRLRWTIGEEVEA